MSEEKKLTEEELEEIFGGYIPVEPDDDDFAIIKFIKEIIMVFNELEKAGLTMDILRHMAEAYKTGGKEGIRKVIMQEITNPELRDLLLRSLDRSKHL